MTDQPTATTHIFVSHSSADAAFVQRLAGDLQRVGVPIWVDHQKLKPGTRNWEKAIREALKKSRALIYVASPTAAQSDYVQDELSIAEMEGCTLLAAWAVGEDKRWLDCTPLGYGKLQNVDMRGEQYDNGLKALLDALSNVPERTITLLPVPVSVVEPEAVRTNLIAEPALSMEHEAEATVVPRNPYKALDAFTEADAQDFFGRDDLIASLLKRLSDFPSFLAVIGASGSGKSSVVMAGLIPILRKQHPDWIILPPIKPGAHPVEALAIMLRNAYFPQLSVKTVREDLESADSRGLIVQAASIPHQPKARIVLLVDQFEELFTQTVSEPEREQFINILTSAATDPGSMVTVLLTLRADFFDRPLRDSELGKLITEHGDSVLPMSITDLKQTIEKPAAGAGLSFDDGLVSDLVFEARDQVGGLPLLQYTLEQLFQRREGVRLTQQAYQEIGGVKGALARRAEETFTDLATDDDRSLTRTLFLRLIEPGVTEQDTTRRRATLSELDLRNPEQAKIIQECAKIFVNTRLLTTNEMGGIKTIEVSHEALIREWKRLGDWLREARDDTRLQRMLSNDAKEWVRMGKRPDDLYRGAKLKEVQIWAERNLASTEELEFIDTSVTADQLETLRNTESRIMRLISMVSHEIRTPLAIISSAASMLRAYSDRLSAEQRENRLITIEKAASSIAELLDDTINIFRSAGREINPSLINIGELCQSVLDSLEVNTHPNLEHSITGNCDNITADERFLRLIIINLLTNAIRFSPNADKISFTVACDDDTMLIRVEDHGIGIPNEEHEHIFESFYIATNARQYAGLGLGLAIVKEAVELHQGIIQIDSTEGKGTVFTVKIPQHTQNI